jgi:PcfJ-like protein
VAKRKTASKEAQRLWVEARRLRQAHARHVRQEHEAREAAIRAALARPKSARLRAEHDGLSRRARKYPPRMQEILDVVRERAPRLVTDDAMRAFKVMAQLEWVRSPVDWQPIGKGNDTLFRSLSEHLFARFRMPPMLWTGFQGSRSTRLARVAAQVAAGGSFFETVRSGLMPVPLTRRMCHEILTCPGEPTFMGAIRRAQVRAAGGSLGFCRAWTRTTPGRQLQDRAREEFWGTVIAWFCRNPVPHAELGPLVDYVAHRRAEEAAFSMKGRTLPALQRGMREWHRDLGRRKSVPHLVFRRSGLQPMDIERRVRNAAGGSARERWHFREVLDTTALADEGRAMGHCAYSYSGQIQSGACSIWTLTLEDATGHWRRLTIEVRGRTVVQARGRFNRQAEARDLVALREWAGRNNLEIASRL